MIPKLIHLTWKSKRIPRIYRQYVKSIVHYHPDWEITLWTDTSMQRFVLDQYPEYQNPYLIYPTMIQRCDFFRLLILYHLGGIYSDLDVLLLKSFNELDKSIEIFFPCEKIVHEDELSKYKIRDPVRIGNYLMGSIPKHPFLKYLLQNLILPQNAKRSIQTNNDVIESTGPGIITRLYHDYIKTHPSCNITIMYPKENNHSHCGCSFYKIASCKIGDFGNHYHRSTWKWSS